jgi:hypothetical protein
MACLLTTGTTTDCAFILQGVTSAWIANFSEMTASTSSSLSMATGKKFYALQFEDGTGNLSQELAVGTTRHVTQSVSFQVASQGQTITDRANEYGLASVVLVVKTKSGKKFIVGRTGSGLRATSLTLSTGAGEGDNNAGMIVTFTGGATEYALEYTGADSTIPV